MQQTATVRRLGVQDPRTGRVEFDLAVADRTSVGVVAARLRQGQPAWAAMDLDARIAVLMRWAQLIDGPFRQPLIDADSRDTGGAAISRVAPDMMLGILRGTAASARAQLAAAQREGVSRSDPAVSSVARVWPAVTCCPTTAETDVTVFEVPDELFAFELLAFEEEFWLDDEVEVDTKVCPKASE